MDNASSECWRDVLGFEGRYEVSNLGRVRNSVTLHILKPMRTGPKRTGSQRSKVRLQTRPRRDFEVGALVLETFVAPRPTGFVVMHLDDDSSNNAVPNLMWGSRMDNCRDCARKTRVGGQKISSEEAADIRRRRTSGESGVSLAAEYGISSQRVCDLVKGRSTLLTEES